MVLVLEPKKRIDTQPKRSMGAGMQTNIFSIDHEVADAMGSGAPVVALESTVITHGLPYPQNLEIANKLEQVIRNEGAVPATIAVLDGKPCVGLNAEQMRRLASEHEPIKLSIRDLAAATQQQSVGGTTVAATMAVANQVGIKIFATGGIGGVHRGGEQSLDISADLTALANFPIAVVCAGAKAILDLEKTLEVLETYGVPVVGYRSREFPAFWSRESGLPLEINLDGPESVAELLLRHWQPMPHGFAQPSGVLIGVPVPKTDGLDRLEIEDLVGEAMAAADKQAIRGKAVTPFLLRWMAANSHGKTVAANLALLEQNARVASKIAVAYRAQAGGQSN
jgi:pseudouridine-5'-phosphate glycosidase